MAKIEFISEFSSVDIDAQKLADELGLKEHRLSSEHDAQVVAMLRDAKSLVADWGEMPYIALGPILKRNEEKIFKIFDSCPVSWRLPLHITSDMFFEITEGSEHGELAFRNIISCWKWYAYVSSQKNDIAFYEGKENGVYAARDRAQEEIQRMMRGSWGRRHKAWMGMIGEKKLVEEFDVRMKSAIEVFFKKARFIPSLEVLQDEMNRLFSSSDVFFEKLFIDNEVSDKNPAIDIPPLNFLLCQNHIACYNELLRNTTRVADGGISDHMPAWREWIKKYFEILMKNDSEVKKGFYYAFSLQGGLFENGKIPKRLRRIKPESTDGIPVELCGLLESLYTPYREAQKVLRRAAKVVEKIPTPAPARTAVEELVSRPLTSKKEEVSLPNSRAFFVRGEEKKQLVSLNLSSYKFPEGTTMIFERQLPREKTFDELDVNKEGETIIPPVLGEKYRGPFIYRLTVTLPTTHIFQGGKSQMLFEDKFYAEAEWTVEEKIAHEEERERIEKARQQRLEEKKQGTEKVVEDTPKKVVTIIDPKIGSLVAAACILLEKCEQYSAIDTYEGGPIVVRISDEDLIAVLNNDSNTLLDEHREWTIQEDDSISPDADDDVREQLLAIGTAIRTKSREKIQKKQEQEQEEREQGEYSEAREEFAPLLDFIRRFKFEGREGDLEKQRASLREELKNYGWSIPGAFAGTKVIWRHITAKIHILYETKQCHSSRIVVEPGGNLNVAEIRCYQEIAEAGAHIARFFNVETRERTKMIKRETALNKEIQTGAEGFDKLLEKGQARLVLFGPYQQSHGLWSSKFPTEATPYMLDERASYSTIEGLIEQYPGAELCYRRDQFCINGEVGEDAGDESHENTSQNINDLRNSPRARYILRKRILITLDLEKYTGDTYRAPIKHEKNKREGSTSALDILLNLKNEKNIQSVADIDESFLDEYINLLDTHKIRVHYVWPISVGLDEHKRLIEKAKKAITTAGGGRQKAAG